MSDPLAITRVRDVRPARYNKSQRCQTRSLWRTFDVQLHICFIIIYVWCHGVRWCHIWSNLAMVKNSLTNNWVHIWILVTLEDWATSILVQVIVESQTTQAWPRCVETDRNVASFQQTRSKVSLTLLSNSFLCKQIKSIGAIFVWVTRQTDRQTDRQTRLHGYHTRLQERE